MITNITLNYIRTRWNPTGSKDSRVFCKFVLPDTYCKDRATNGKKYYFDAACDDSSPPDISSSTLAGIMRGNRKSQKDGSSPAGGFTSFFIENLRNNSEITYHKSLNRNPEKFRDNMFHKIWHSVRDKASPRSGEHPLFKDRDFVTTFGCPEEIKSEYLKVDSAISALLSKETEVTISYAILLLIVTAIVQDRIIEVSSLYAPESIEKVFEYDTGSRLIETSSKAISPFVDPGYMDHLYHLYLFRESTNELWHAASLIIEVDKDEHRRPTATMILSDDITSPVSGDSEMVRKYIGTPMLSEHDRTVYIAMTDQKDTFAFLMFPYKSFNFAPMYYRNAVLLKNDPESHSPQLQKVAIVARALSLEELPYVRGLLKTDEAQVLLTESQLNLFKEKFANEKWMTDFQKNYLPLFEKHKKTYYCISDDEILSCSMSDLNANERLQVLLALKSVDPPNNMGTGKFVRSNSPRGTHKLLK